MSINGLHATAGCRGGGILSIVFDIRQARAFAPAQECRGWAPRKMHPAVTRRIDVLLNCCVVVADTAGARLFLAERDDAGSVRLREYGLVQNGRPAADGAATLLPDEGSADEGKSLTAPRPRAHGAIKARLASDIAEKIAVAVHGWRTGSVVVAADPDLLGLLRQVIQAALPPGVTLRSLARDHVGLSPEELAQRLDLA